MNPEAADSVYHFLASSDPLAPTVREAVQVIENTIDEFGPEHLAISFNGGKDCTVLLYLYAAVLCRRGLYCDRKYANGSSNHDNSLAYYGLSGVATSSSSPSSSTTSLHLPLKSPIRGLYVMCEQPFQEVESFINQTVEEYDLDLLRVGGPMKDALAAYLGLSSYFGNDPISCTRPKSISGVTPGHGVKAMFIGTRRNDPHGAKLGFVNPTDRGWPALQRVHPIINWTYHDVWAFLRCFKVPYCPLYDLGYTSLGSTHNTYPNPALQVKCVTRPNSTSEPGPLIYKPAYELTDGNLERTGRGTGDSARTLTVPNILPSDETPSVPIDSRHQTTLTV